MITLTNIERVMKRFGMTAIEARDFLISIEEANIRFEKERTSISVVKEQPKEEGIEPFSSAVTGDDILAAMKLDDILREYEEKIEHLTQDDHFIDSQDACATAINTLTTSTNGIDVNAAIYKYHQELEHNECLARDLIALMLECRKRTGKFPVELLESEKPTTVPEPAEKDPLTTELEEAMKEGIVKFDVPRSLQIEQLILHKEIEKRAAIENMSFEQSNELSELRHRYMNISLGKNDDKHQLRPELRKELGIDEVIQADIDRFYANLK